MGKLRLVDPASDRTKALRHRMHELIKQHDEPIAGFVIVTWDGRGACTTSMNTADGPVATGLVPALVGSALNRHVILDKVEESIAESGLR